MNDVPGVCPVRSIQMNEMVVNANAATSASDTMVAVWLPASSPVARTERNDVKPAENAPRVEGHRFFAR
jgi:hypothetical protein